MTRAPEEIFQHHAEALGAGDLDEIVADYADDAVFITPALLLRTPERDYKAGACQPFPAARARRIPAGPSATRRAAAIIGAKAVSAVVSVSTSGVLQARTPCRVQASASMLSKPTP